MLERFTKPVTPFPFYFKVEKFNDQFKRRPNYKACPSESGTEVGAPLFPAVELCIFPVDGSVSQEEFGIHSMAAVCC
jgi:hypothetical protein